MSSSDIQVQPYNSILDVAGKLVGGFGLVLGLAYISGWVYLHSLHKKFAAPWVTDLYDAPALVQTGLQWVVVCCVFTSLIFMCFKKSDDVRHAAMGTLSIAAFGYVAVAVLASLLGIRSDSMPLMGFAGPLIMGLASCYCIAAALRATTENKNLVFALTAALFGLVLMIIINPWMYAETISLDMKYKPGSQIIVSNKETALNGILIGITGGKLIISECKTHNIYIFEPDNKTSFTKAKELCV